LIIMGKKGNVRHFKSLSAPLYLGIHRKGSVYVTKPNGGRHTIDKSIALVMLVKRLGIAPENNTETERIIRRGLILVNNKVIREPSYPVGLNDIIEVANEKKHFKIGINDRSKIEISEMQKPDYDNMLYKVTGKYKTKKEAIMLRLHDGSVVKGVKGVDVNDSVIVNSKGAVSKVLKLEKGAKCIVIDGVHAGTSGKITDITEGTLHMRHSATIQQKDGKDIITIVKNMMVME
jgi:small subunit ribosomal protein S4e